MIAYTVSEIADIVDKVVMEQREAIGNVGRPRNALMLEGNDGRWVSTQPVTDLEHHLICIALYGELRAESMQRVVKASREAGNVEHDLSGL